MTRWLLRLYPRAWRERYGDEFVALITAEGPRPRVLLDVLRSAIGERVRWGAPGTAPVVRRVIGCYCLLHTAAWLLNWVIAYPVRTTEWWTVDALMLSAAIQARSAMVTCAVGLTALWLVRRRSHKTRSTLHTWLRFGLAISVPLVERMLSTIGVQPTRALATVVFGESGHMLLLGGAMVLVGEWLTAISHRWLNPEPLIRPLDP